MNEPEIRNESLSCPHCKVILEKTAKKKIKCSSCGKNIFVRGNHPVADVARGKIEVLKQISFCGITEEYFDKRHAELPKDANGFRSYRDTAWAIMSEQVRDLSDLHQAKMHYFTMALFLAKEGKDFTHVRQLSHECELRRMKDLGISQVRFLTGACCKNCNEDKNKIISIEEAFAAKPLPHANCTTDRERYSNERGWCLCHYAGVFENDKKLPLPGVGCCVYFLVFFGIVISYFMVLRS